MRASSDLVRMAVLEIYEQVRREGARADQAMQRVIRRDKQLRSVERRAVADAVYGLLRLQGRVDARPARSRARHQELTLATLATPTEHLLRYGAYLVVGGSRARDGGQPRRAGGDAVSLGAGADGDAGRAVPSAPRRFRPSGASRSTPACRAGSPSLWQSARRAETRALADRSTSARR